MKKKGETGYEQNDVGYSDQAYLEAFLSLFSVIRERFLFSKFGIVTYLSTRIRHGVFLGELRPELEKYNLIFYKNNLKDKYEPSDWVNALSMQRADRERLIHIITEFSSDIDGLISKIIKDNIQINIGKDNINGWFNYNFSEEELSQLAVTFYYENDYKSFCKKVLDVLWTRTDENLEYIRKVLQGDVKANFVTALNKFEAALNQLPSNAKPPEIYTALSACSTSLQVKIDKIATWFNRSGKIHVDFNLKDLTGIICSNIQRRYPMKTLHTTYTSNFDKLIRGEFYEHFNDFIGIFIDNMFKHSNSNLITCSINVQDDGSCFSMTIENDGILPDAEIPYERDGIRNILDGIKLVTEGKSGLVKANKTIKDDLRNDSNGITFQILEKTFKVTVQINYSNLIV